jgi:hypothetical protein
LQKLLRTFASILIVFVTTLATLHSPLRRGSGDSMYTRKAYATREALCRRRASRTTNRAPPAVEQRTTAKPTGDQPRDPADIALEKKIKSICRGC